MFPQDPNYRVTGSRTNLPAWFLITRADGARVVYQMTGWAFIFSLQTLLRQRTAPNSPTYDGTISGTAVAVDGRTGANTLKAVYAKAIEFGAPPIMLGSIQTDTAARQISVETQRIMAWVLMRMVGADVPLGYVELPARTTTLPFGTTPARTEVFLPVVQVLSNPTVTPVNDTDPGITDPTDLGDGSSPVPVTNETNPNKPPGGTYVDPRFPAPPGGGSSEREATLSWPIVGAAAGLILGVGWLAWSTINEDKPARKSKPKARKNPSNRARNNSPKRAWS